MERETRIPEVDAVPEGWELNGDPIIVPEHARDALEEAVVDAISILRHVGGVIQIAPVRRPLAQDVYVTTEYVFRWHSFVPAIEDEEDAEELQPVAAE